MVAHSTREEKKNMVPTIHRLVSRWTSNGMDWESGFVYCYFCPLHAQIHFTHKYVYERWVLCRMLYSKLCVNRNNQQAIFFVYSILFNCFSCHFFVGFIRLLCVPVQTDASIQLYIINIKINLLQSHTKNIFNPPRSKQKHHHHRTHYNNSNSIKKSLFCGDLCV